MNHLTEEAQQDGCFTLQRRSHDDAYANICESLFISRRRVSRRQPGWSRSLARARLLMRRNTRQAFLTVPMWGYDLR